MNNIKVDNKLTIILHKVDNRSKNSEIGRRVAKQLVEGKRHRHLLKYKHLRFLRFWVRRFAFPVPVALYVFTYRCRGFNHALARLSTFKETAWIGLSTRTLKDGDDWQNSIIHELIHLLFLLTMGESRTLSHQAEEDLVIMISTWLSRSKSGRTYAKKIYG